MEQNLIAKAAAELHMNFAEVLEDINIKRDPEQKKSRLREPESSSISKISVQASKSKLIVRFRSYE